jgi:hypothetical protein
MNIDSTAPAAPPPAPAAAPIPLPPGSYRQELKPSEAEIFAGWIKEDVAKGKVTPEQAEKSFTQLNTPAEQRAPDTRSEEEVTLDLLSPAAKPADYRIVYDHIAPGQPVPDEVKAFDTAARTWLAESGLPRELGNSLVNIVDRVSKATAHMDPAALERYGFAQLAILEKTYGADLEKKLQQAGRMVQELEKKQPGLNALLRGAIGDDARVASLLIQQSEIYFARKGRGGKNA